MSRGLLIGGLALGGGALLALALREREPLGRAAVVVHTTAQEAVRRGARKVSEIVQGKIKQEYLDRIAKYNIGPLVEKYRGGVPWGVAMAIIEHESKFQPDIFNYYDSNNKLQQGYYKGPGTRQPKGGANGLYQIMSHLIPASKGYDAPTIDSLFDPETNIRAALKARNNDLTWIASNVPPGIDASVLANLTYMAHAEGLGKVQWGMKQMAKAEPFTWAVFGALPWLMGKKAWKAAGAKSGDKIRLIYNRFPGLASAGERAPVWEAKKAEIMGGVAVGATPEQEESQDSIASLLEAIQRAEMERDLMKVVALQEQLDDMVPDEFDEEVVA